jgi:isopentenyl phosphate kinase
MQTNVKGIYDRPPNEDSGAILLRRIIVGTHGSWQAFDGSGAPTAACMVQIDVSDHDTTGGMRAKVHEALEIAMMGVATRVVEAGTRSALEACLNQELAPEWVGTEIVG